MVNAHIENHGILESSVKTYRPMYSQLQMTPNDVHARYSYHYYFVHTYTLYALHLIVYGFLYKKNVNI